METVLGWNTIVKPGDRLLFVGDKSAHSLQRRYLTEPGTVSWMLTGTEPRRGLVFRWLHSRSRSRMASEPIASDGQLDTLDVVHHDEEAMMGNRDKQGKEPKKPKKPPAPKPTP